MRCSVARYGPQSVASATWLTDRHDLSTRSSYNWTPPERNITLIINLTIKNQTVRFCIRFQVRLKKKISIERVRVYIFAQRIKICS